MSGDRRSATPVPFDAVVVAAGSSSRMRGVDKLTASVAGRPVLAWSIDALAQAGAERIVVVTSADRVASLAQAPWLPPAVVAVVAGGLRRQESVAAGVGALGSAAPGSTVPAPMPATTARAAAREAAAHEAAAPHRVVLIHDAARPVATPGLCRRVAAAAAERGAVIPVTPVAETLKRLDGDRIAGTVEREGLVGAQTPQGFRRDLLEAAFATFPPDGERTWTDEAALLEACRIPVYAIDGEAGNLKVTLPGDLHRAEAFLTQREQLPPPAVRVGFGTDSHPFGAGKPLALGGVVFAGMPRLAGHSDGDVVLHAIADAVLGAAALGDLGSHFPADRRTPAGIPSRELLRAAVALVGAHGWRPSSVDVTIVGARPRLGDRLAEMASVVASLLEIPEGAASVKASTGNLEGADGAGRTISAHAVAVLVAGTPIPDQAEGER